MGDADRKLNALKRHRSDPWREVNYKLWQHNVDMETRKRYVDVSV